MTDPALAPVSAETAVLDQFRVYLRSRSLRERALETENRLKATLLDAVVGLEQSGSPLIEKDEGGSITLRVDDQIIEGGRELYGYQRQRRESRVLNPDKVDALIKEFGWDPSMVYTIEVIPEHEEITLEEDKLLALHYQEKISTQQLKDLYDVSETYAMVLVK